MHTERSLSGWRTAQFEIPSGEPRRKSRSRPAELPRRPDDRPAGFRRLLHDRDVFAAFHVRGSTFRPDEFATVRRTAPPRLTTMLCRDHEGSSRRPSFNPNIPSGYTYLLQLIAHDLVESSLLLSLCHGTETYRPQQRPRQALCGSRRFSAAARLNVRMPMNSTRTAFVIGFGLAGSGPTVRPYDANTGALRDIARARATEALRSQPELSGSAHCRRPQ